MIDLSTAAALSARTAYSTLHAITLMIGAPRKSAASGLIPNANVQKNNMRPHFCGLFFLCKSSRLLAVTSVLPLSISFFFPSLSARAAAHFGCMVGRYSLADTEKPGGISLLTIGRTGRCPVVGFVYCNCIIFADK